MKARKKVIKYYSKYTGVEPDIVSALPGSGSDRKYFRVVQGEKSLIAVLNKNREENDAFVHLAEIFRVKGLPVPEIYKYYPGKNVYFQSDLGDTNLFTWLEEQRQAGAGDNEIYGMYCKVLEKLVAFQLETINKIDLELCYPHRSFDRQSMMWDMNYFKYMFLKLVGISFSEKKLEKDFETLADALLEAGQEYFMYRDFQSANIMIIDDSSPWFIDFQGGRAGAPQYDVASLLYDSKACLSGDLRNRLLEHYMDRFCSESGYARDTFFALYPSFILVRIMQAMGAYGYRGLFEKKAGFAQSISPAVKDLHSLFGTTDLADKLPELGGVVERLHRKQAIFDKLK